MLGKILGRKKKESNGDKSHEELVQKIAKMNLTDMRNYVNAKQKDLEIDEDGLCEVMRRLLSKDSDSKRFIESDAMDSKIKKAFELVLVVAASKKITVVAIELIQEFIEQYLDIIKKYDSDNKEIYESRLKDAVSNATNIIVEITEIKKKMGVLK